MEVAVLEISTGDAKFDVAELCHLLINPVLPVNVNVVEFVPAQTVAPPVIVPPTEEGSTSTLTIFEVIAVEQLEEDPETFISQK